MAHLHLFNDNMILAYDLSFFNKIALFNIILLLKYPFNFDK